MATTSTNPAGAVPPKTAPDVKETSTLMTLLPYIIAIGAQLPLFILYFRNLWERPHYGWFPFAFIAVAALAWMRCCPKV